jgi:hypothetical protein
MPATENHPPNGLPLPGRLDACRRWDNATREGNAMPHDKIKEAARRRMAETGEPYAVARRAVMKQHEAAQSRSRQARDEGIVAGPAGVAGRPAPGDISATTTGESAS